MLCIEVYVRSPIEALAATDSKGFMKFIKKDVVTRVIAVATPFFAAIDVMIQGVILAASFPVLLCQRKFSAIKERALGIIPIIKKIFTDAIIGLYDPLRLLPFSSSFALSVKLMSHRFSLEGGEKSGDRTISMEGFSSKFRNIIFDSLHSSAANFFQEEETKKAFSFTDEDVKKTLELFEAFRDIQRDTSKILELSKTKPVILPVYLKNHLIMAAIFKDYLIICNRGGKIVVSNHDQKLHLDPGLQVYTMIDRSNLEEIINYLLSKRLRKKRHKKLQSIFVIWVLIRIFLRK